MSDYFVLSNFGVRYFLEDYDPDVNDGIPTSGSNELEGVVSCTLGEITKDVKKYKTLNGDGWDSIAPLGQSQGDGSFELIRMGTGDPFVGSTGNSTYTKLKKWFMDSTAEGGSVSPKCIVEILPRGNNTYEGICYYVIPSKWGAGKKDTETGQEYSFDVTPFGPQQPVVVTHTPAAGSTPESWAFAKPST